MGAARKALSEAERSIGELSNRQSALEEAKLRLNSSLEEASGFLKEAEVAKAALPAIDALESKSQVVGNTTSQRRALLAEIRAEFQSLARENAMRVERLEAIGRERAAWNERAINADRQIRTLRERLAETIAQRDEAEAAPDEILARRRELMNQIESAEITRKAAADMLASMENDQREADKVATAALNALSDAKQSSARSEERVAAARERRSEIEARIVEELECQPHEALKQTGVDDENKLPDQEAVERKLERLKGERERPWSCEPAR